MVDIKGWISDRWTDIEPIITDYENPLVSYAYLIAIALFLRFLLIVVPLFQIYWKYYEKGMLRKSLQLKKITSLKGVEGFIIAEIVVMLLPALIALIVRYGILGGAPAIDWTNEQIALALIAGSLWLIVDANQTLKTHKPLKTVLHWYENPSQVNQILDDIMWTRERLVKVSNKVSEWQIDSNQKNEVVDNETEQSTISKIGNFFSSSFESVKVVVQSTLKDVAEKGIQRIDSTLQKKVDQVIKDSPPRRWKSFAVNLTCSIWPFIFIYYLLPLLS